MANWLESYKSTARLHGLKAHSVKDPDVSPYALLQAKGIAENPEVQDFFVAQAKPDGDRTFIDIDVSELRRTWETAVLIVAFLNKERQRDYTVRLHKYKTLNEVGGGRDNQPEKAGGHHEDKFKSWYEAYNTHNLWSKCPEGQQLKLPGLKALLSKIQLPNYVFAEPSETARTGKSGVVVGHSKWYETHIIKKLKDTGEDKVRLVYAGEKKVRYADTEDETRIDKFVNTHKEGVSFLPCGLTYAHYFIPRGRCCLETTDTLVEGKATFKPGSGQVTSIEKGLLHNEY